MFCLVIGPWHYVSRQWLLKMTLIETYYLIYKYIFPYIYLIIDSQPSLGLKRVMGLDNRLYFYLLGLY